MADIPKRTNTDTPASTAPHHHLAPNANEDVSRDAAEEAVAALFESGDVYEEGSEPDGGAGQNTAGNDPPIRDEFGADNSVSTDDQGEAEAIEEAFAEMFGEDAAESPESDEDASSEADDADDFDDAPGSRRLDEILGEDADTSEIMVKVTENGEAVEIPLSEALSGHLRQRDYTRKTQEIAEQRNEVEQAADLIRSEAAKHSQKLGLLKKALANAGVDVNLLQQVNAEHARLEQALQAEAEHAITRETERQREILSNAAPHIDKARLAELRDFATEGLGFSEQDLAGVTDHRLILTLDKAKRADELQAELDELREAGDNARRTKRKKGVKTLKPSGKTASSRKGKSTSKRKVPVRSDGSLSKAAAAGVLSGLFS